MTSDVVPTLLESDEPEQLMDSVRDEVIASGQLDTPNNCWYAFNNRCRDNIHICLCFSLSGDDLRRRCRDFPGHVSSTIIDWFDPLSEEALSTIFKHFIEEEHDLIDSKYSQQLFLT